MTNRNDRHYDERILENLSAVKKRLDAFIEKMNDGAYPKTGMAYLVNTASSSQNILTVDVLSLAGEGS